jgi:EmrB/QacA subfamily drug resistance transporter
MAAAASATAQGRAFPTPDRRFTLLVTVGILLALLMGALDNFVALTALPKILSDFNQLNSGTFVISAYVIASTASIPIFARLSDLWSRRNVFLGGLIIFMVGSVLSGLSQNITQLIVFRAVQGFGSGDFFPVGVAIVAVTFPPEARAKVVGALSGVFGIAVVAGPLLGSAIVDYTTWRWVFYVNLPVGLLGFAIIASTLGALRPERIRPFDVPGAALLVSWVSTLMFPLYQIADNGWGWTNSIVIGLFSATAVLLVLFIYWELRTIYPLVPLRLFKQRVISAGGGATFSIGLVFFPVATFLSLVVGIVLVPGNGNASNTVRDILYFLVIPLVLGAALGGQLLTRVTYRIVAITGILIAIVGMIGLTEVSASTPLWIFYLGFIPVGGLVLTLMPLGFGIGLTFPVFVLAAQNQVGKLDIGEAGGLIQFLQSLGGAVGLSLLASFQQTRLSAIDPSPNPSCQTATPLFPQCASYLSGLKGAIVTSYDQTFTVMLGLLFVALTAAMFLKGRLPRGTSGSSPVNIGADVPAQPTAGNTQA